MNAASPDRYVWKKNSKTQYDPQIGAAAQANAAVAERAQAWTEDFYAKTISPLLDEMAKNTRANTEQQGKLFDLNYAETQLQDKRYRELGIPAEDRYYKMVDDYSSADEQERQAQRALGDVRTAEANQQQQLQRKFAGLGIDPGSPAAVSAMTDMAVQNAAIEAAASTRARDAAKTLGMSLISDAANFGRGGASGVLQFGGAASGNSSAATGASQSAVNTASNAANPMQNAFGIASRAYGANLDAYSGLQRQAMEARAQSQAGLGQLIGLIGSAAIGASDRRVKTDVKLLIEKRDLPNVYEFRYIWDEPGTRRIGYMADEVEPLFPEAVLTGPGGYKMIDYSRVPR